LELIVGNVRANMKSCEKWLKKGKARNRGKLLRAYRKNGIRDIYTRFRAQSLIFR
jgi:hypothetical protein